MTRIIGGALGGRRIAAPPGAGTRPTSDRVREAIFSALEARIELDGVHVLDLYAGSGALGLEAASRGAARVVLVEHDRRAAATIRRNVADLGLDGVVTVAARAVSAVLDGPPADADLVFLDPPYDVGEDVLAGVLAALAAAHLTPEAVVVVERSSRSPEPTWPPGVHRTGDRTYGETRVWYAQASAPPDPDGTMGP
ncbi:16S rRNA (guanine(966)-N(2))-methyltransferase RsmD [Janibacter massiliensis]|uniref:16S rRNA (guanine(966)-N(2))-methyltransferase RsmD n=1 Tax=Janibacter massiliensis TaxID=2058291 RepID=UPI000D0FB4CA|nr:16S rRNA (guanine(966)-N(2))-methyltransferase RsmD [Janibacter massiliensis]